MNGTCTVIATTFLALLLSMVSFPGVALAQSSRADLITPYPGVAPGEELTVRRAAITALRSISRARLAIHRNKPANARRDLVQAGRWLEAVRDDLSTAPVKNFIQVARKHLEYEPAHQVQQDLPLIYASLAMLSGYLPTHKVKLHIDRAKDCLERNDKQGADRELALGDDALVIIEVEFPLTMTRKYVKIAQGYLAAGQAGRADKALQTAEKVAITLYTGMNSPPFPLFQAKGNIWLALRDYPSAKEAYAGPFLEKARLNLEKAAAGVNGPGNKEAGKLSKEIAELEKRVSGGGKVAESELKGAWEKSKALAERDADYLAAGWAKEEAAGLHREDNLIEAKLHLAYAESYQVTSAEPANAADELANADDYLTKALQSQSLGVDTGRNIAELKRKIEQIKLNTRENDAMVEESYDAVMANLNRMIQHVETSGQVRKMEGSE